MIVKQVVTLEGVWPAIKQLCAEIDRIAEQAGVMVTYR
jgi:hypothetical protein